MSWTYDFTNFPDLSLVRLLVFDTDATAQIFQDAEVNAAIQVESSQSGFGSGPPGIIVGLTGYSPAVPVLNVVSHRRAAALLLRSLSAGKARNLVQQVLDVKIDGSKAAASLKQLADSYIEDEMNAGYFAISEMVNDTFSMRERLWKQLYRLVA